MIRVDVKIALTSYLQNPVVKLLDRLGFSPNMVTLLGLAVTGTSAYLVSTGHLWAGGATLLFSGLFDLFDGALARFTGKSSDFGALLDSVVDRVSEVLVLLGLIIFYLHRSSIEGIVLAYLALSGSMMVSYVRARAEGLGARCGVGIMTRPERLITLGLGLVVAHWWVDAVKIALVIIVVLTFITTLHRTFYAKRKLEGQK